MAPNTSLQKGYNIKAKPWRSENSVPMNLWFLRLSGWWGDESWSRQLSLLYSGYTIFNIVAHLVLVVTVFINMVVEWEAILVVMDDANILLVGITNSAKIFPFIFSRYKVLRCLRRLERMEAAGKSSAQRQELEEGARRFTRRVAWTLICSCMTSCLFWTVAPLAIFRGSLFAGAEEDATAFNSSTATDEHDSGHKPLPHKPLPLQGWLPFDINSSPGWEFGYTILSISTWVDSWIACHTNGIFFAFMYFSYIQFRVLCVHLREIRPESERILKDKEDNVIDSGRQGESKDGNGTNNGRLPITLQSQELPSNLQTEMNLRLRNAVHHHQTILSFIDAVQDLLGPVMFTECLAMSIMLCAVVFQATLVDMAGMKFVALMAFLVFELLELLCFCWAGTLLMLQSEMVSQAAFDCGWEDSSASFKTCLRFMMMRAQKPSQVTALGFSTLSLQLFAALLRASYSYYAVLSQANAEPVNT